MTACTSFLVFFGSKCLHLRRKILSRPDCWPQIVRFASGRADLLANQRFVKGQIIFKEAEKPKGEGGHRVEYIQKEKQAVRKMLKQRREKQQEMELVIMEQMIPEDHLLRKVDRAVDFSFIYELCAPLYCADNGRPAIDPEVLFRMLLVGYLYGVKSEARLEEEVNYNIAYKWFCGLGLTEKAPDATTISQNRRRRFRDNNIAEQIFNEILRQCIAKGLVGGAILYTDSTHIKAKANKHKKKLVSVEQTPKAYMEELDAQVDQDRKVLGKKPFDRDDEDHMDGGMTKRMHSTSDPESGQQSREGKPDGFHYSEHRTVDSKRNVIVNVHIEPANLNDVTPLPEILDEIQVRLGKLPKYMGLDAGYHNTWIAHLLEKKESRVSLATGGTPTRHRPTANIASNTTLTLMLTSARSTSISTGKPPPARAIANTSVTAKPVRSAHDGQSALEQV